MESRKAFRLNAPGDFYVEDQCCIFCHAPEKEAPELMAHDVGYEHCYFNRQPRTPEETNHAVLAVAVSCCGAVRYRGRDPEIIERLTKAGSRDNCDHAAATMRGMKLLRVDYRLWLIGAMILILVGGLYTWVFTQNHHPYPSKELTELRNDYQKKLMDYVRARDECDEQFEAAVNGDWDNREKVLAARDKVQPARDKVIELGELSEEAGRKLRAAE